MQRVLIAMMLCAGLSACGVAKIDGTSEETMQSSVENIKGSLDKEQRAEFENAIVVITFDALGKRKDIMGTVNDPKALSAVILKALHGKNAQDVIADSARIMKEKEARRSQAQAAKSKDASTDALPALH